MRITRRDALVGIFSATAGVVAGAKLATRNVCDQPKGKSVTMIFKGDTFTKEQVVAYMQRINEALAKGETVRFEF